MKYRLFGVVSDSHGDRDRLANIMMALEYKKVEGVIHLGDGYRDMAPFEKAFPQVWQVAGNCDFSSLERQAVLSLGGMRVLITHGQGYLVKSTLDLLCDGAESLGAKAALFGHTHEPLMEYRRGILLLNPGSAREGRYAVLRIPQEGYPEADLF